MNKLKLVSMALAFGMMFSAVSAVSAAANRRDIGVVKKSGSYVFTTEINSITSEFKGIKPPQGAFNKPALDADEKAIKEYIEYQTRQISLWVIDKSFVKEASMGVEGDKWVERSFTFKELDAEFVNRNGEFQMANNGFTKDWDKLDELKKYASAIGNKDLYQYYNQTLYLYSLAKKHDNYMFYAIGKKRLVALNNALGN